MNSVLSKVLETLVLSRMEGCLAEAGLPHLNQSQLFVSMLDVLMPSKDPKAKEVHPCSWSQALSVECILDSSF